MLTDADGDELAARVAQTMLDVGADTCNVRIHVPGVDPAAARAQIARLGDEVVPRFAATLLAQTRRPSRSIQTWMRRGSRWVPSARRLTRASLPGFRAVGTSEAF